jgi:hypothetical protein
MTFEILLVKLSNKFSSPNQLVSIGSTVVKISETPLLHNYRSFAYGIIWLLYKSQWFISSSYWHLTFEILLVIYLWSIVIFFQGWKHFENITSQSKITGGWMRSFNRVYRKTTLTVRNSQFFGMYCEKLIYNHSNYKEFSNRCLRCLGSTGLSQTM